MQYLFETQNYYSPQTEIISAGVALFFYQASVKFTQSRLEGHRFIQ